MRKEKTQELKKFSDKGRSEKTSMKKEKERRRGRSDANEASAVK